MRFLYALYRYFFYFPMFLVLFLINSTLTIIAALFLGRARAQFFYRQFSRLLVFMAGARLTITGREHLGRKQSYVIVSNHRSNFDPIILWAALPVTFLWIMKIELIRIPVFGFMMKLLGFVGIDRRNSQEAIKSINQAKARLVNGTCITFFPEGTRHTAPGVGVFKKGAFQFALDTGLPILPVSISGSERILPPHSLNLSYGKVKVVIHPPVPTTGLDRSEMNTLIESIQRAVASGYDSSY
jgi:1-acyl-sn-glycerol-3-phosphate acyltransferase